MSLTLSKASVNKLMQKSKDAKIVFIAIQIK